LEASQGSSAVRTYLKNKIVEGVSQVVKQLHNMLESLGFPVLKRKTKKGMLIEKLLYIKFFLGLRTQ
jgi:hypothetical protein